MKIKNPLRAIGDFLEACYIIVMLFFLDPEDFTHSDGEPCTKEDFS